MSRIYLDNAATSWPKPPEVYDAVDRWQRENGAAAGRGLSPESIETDRLIDEARRGTARLLGVDDARRIVFTLNGTDSLHLAIQGLVRPGDHLVTTDAEHNSVLRPLRQLADRRGVAVTHVKCDEAGRYSVDDVVKALGPRTAFVVATHASNVTGAVQPAAALGEALRRRGVPFVVDAAQTVGEWPFTVAELPCDLLAAPGHKGLLGPLGTGILYVRPEFEDRFLCIRTGGTGTESRSTLQPTELPHKYESGNPNVPGIVGLGAGVKWLAAQGVEALHRRLQSHTARFLEGLAGMAGVRLVGPRDVNDRLPVVSLTLDGYDPQEAAAVLATSFGIQVRAGFHCASRIHKSLGTEAGGGTIRFSFGPFTTPDEIDAALAALRQMTAAA